MPIVVNTNAAATTAAFNLSKNHANLSKSLARLSSGNRITQPSEDAGGLAVAYKLDSSIKRTEAVINNHQNALSYLQVQDGAMENVGSILTRMAELRTMAADVTKNANDIENYSKEFRELQEQLNQVKRMKFNGVSLFAISANDTSNLNTSGIATDSLSINASGEYFGDLDKDGRLDSTTNPYTYHKYHRQLLTDPSGQSANGSLDLNVVNLQFVLSIGTLDGSASSFTSSNINLGGFKGNNGMTVGDATSDIFTNEGYISSILHVSVGSFTEAIQRIADVRAENGAEQSRIQQSLDLQSTNLVNLEAAHGRIMDVDVALESTRFAKHNVLVQASASMTAQANQLTQVALTLLQ
jgi:flagellin